MTIKEVSEKFDLTPDTLRYYEKEGLIGPVKKTSSGIRNYEEQDLNRIEFVKCMRSADIPVHVLLKYIQLYEIGDETLLERRNLLDNQRKVVINKIKEMEKALDKLNFKIKMYDEKKLDNKLD